ncbi:MAG TPA: hypothetical protein VGL59_13155 [Polyangia bacterium]
MSIPTLDQISEELRDVTLQVHLAQERPEERDLVRTAQEGVERLSSRYREMYGALSAGEQIRVDRTLGRRVVDVKRLASLLPKVAQVSGESTPDRLAGTSSVGERRITGVSWSHGRGVTGGPSLRVGGEAEAWCGKCGASTTHNIVAMVGAEAKQVLCQVCNSRHAYRTTPARPKNTESAVTAGDSRGKSSADPEAARRAELQRVLVQEVQAAADIRPFDPKGRYKAGEIISHSEYGRGKIENVLRSSLLVRFTNGGLKSVMLQ